MVYTTINVCKHLSCGDHGTIERFRLLNCIILPKKLYKHIVYKRGWDHSVKLVFSAHTVDFMDMSPTVLS